MEREPEISYKYQAFISYSHRDMGLARRLHRIIEWYRLPAKLQNDVRPRNRFLQPVFRDETDLNAGVLSDELSRHLMHSKYLILICSEHSAASEWVSLEAQAFIDMGRVDRIIPVVIPSQTAKDEQLYPLSLQHFRQEHPQSDILGVRVEKKHFFKTIVKVVSYMLGLDFDQLWKRHLRMRRKVIGAFAGTVIVVLSLLYLFAVPVQFSVDMEMQQSSLPVVQPLELNIDGARYYSSPASPEFDRIALPGYKRFGKVHITAKAQFFNTVDTAIPTGFGTARSILLTMTRDDAFATYAGRVYNAEMEGLPGVKVRVGGVEVHEAVSDSAGRFGIVLPLSAQRSELPVCLEKEGYTTVCRPDETPGGNLKYIMHRE